MRISDWSSDVCSSDLPIGALCAVITYEYLRRSGHGASALDVVSEMIAAAIIAALIGFSMAKAIAWSFPRGHVTEFLKAPVLLVVVIVTFVLTNLIQPETGLMVVTVERKSVVVGKRVSSR